MKLRGPVYPNKNGDAWYYENSGSIDVYIAQTASVRGAVSVRIPRRFLADWIARTAKKKETRDE